MQKDVEYFLRGTVELCPGLEGARLAAIADFAYNLGLERLKYSTLRKRVVSEDWAAVKQELVKWVNGGGKKLPGLVLRRDAEAKLL